MHDRKQKLLPDMISSITVNQVFVKEDCVEVREQLFCGKFEQCSKEGHKHFEDYSSNHCEHPAPPSRNHYRGERYFVSRLVRKDKAVKPKWVKYLLTTFT